MQVELHQLLHEVDVVEGRAGVGRLDVQQGNDLASRGKGKQPSRGKGRQASRGKGRQASMG